MWNNSFKMVLNQIFCSAIMEKQYRVHLNFYDLQIPLMVQKMFGVHYQDSSKVEFLPQI